MGIFRHHRPKRPPVEAFVGVACLNCGSELSDPDDCPTCHTPTGFDDYEELDAGGLFDEED
ncbi:MAG: hypothetical protein HOF47_06325 [Actinobacteria bacterium]|jgi:uncharacterized OB-fold protein|nr:hypothetical protein [Actinomycetota bacterium]